MITAGVSWKQTVRFPQPRPKIELSPSVAAALRMRDAMQKLNADRGGDDLLLKIGIYEGLWIAVSRNQRQDYFGQTVNIASRVQHLATAAEIFRPAQC